MRWDIVFGYNVWNQHGICYQHLAPKWSKCRELSHSKLIWLWVKSLGIPLKMDGWYHTHTHTHLHTTRNWNLSKVVTYDFYVGFTKISGSDIETWFVMWVCLVESLDFNVDYVDCTKKKYGCFSWLGWETWAVWLHDVDDWINKNQVDRTSRFNSLSMVLKQKNGWSDTVDWSLLNLPNFTNSHEIQSEISEAERQHSLGSLGWNSCLCHMWTSMDKHGLNWW